MSETAETQVEAQAEKPETIFVNDLDHFITLLVRWHDTKCRLLKHMCDIPADATFEIDGVDQPFTPEMRKGFILAIDIALAELGTLPFAAETDEEEPTAANDAQAD
jgi:hypothetical protein